MDYVLLCHSGLLDVSGLRRIKMDLVELALLFPHHYVSDIDETKVFTDFVKILLILLHFECIEVLLPRLGNLYFYNYLRKH